jgi:26S proteasome regulatory subunit N1
MANEGERPTSADKGKGKVDDVRELNGNNTENGEKAPVDGKKKDEESPDGTLRYQSQ